MNYPDNIRQYDHDPRSPFYDDSKHEEFIEHREKQLMDDVLQLNNVDIEHISEIIMEEWNFDNVEMLDTLDDYFRSLAEKQAESEWKGK